VTYRPTEFQVNNSGGIECNIFMDPETLLGGTVYFVIQQDAERVTVSLKRLENLLECANELLQAAARQEATRTATRLTLVSSKKKS
jgi:hypothetical protein